MEKINILILVDELRRGGKERQLFELVRGIDKSRFSIILYSFFPRVDGYDREIQQHLSGFGYFHRRIRWDFSVIPQLVNLCRREHIGIIHAWDGMTAFFGLAAGWVCGIPFVNGSIRDTDARLSYRHLVKRLVLLLSRNIVANSFAGLNVYHVIKKGEVIYNGIDPGRFTMKKEYQGSEFVIGIVANLSEYKDYYTFFSAIDLLRNDIRHLRVVIIGDGRLKTRYLEFARSLGLNDQVLDFRGRLVEVEPLVPTFDIGILCSYKKNGEGLSNSVLEYMISGVPSVVTDTGAMREIIDEKIDGLLYAPETPADLARKILSLYKDPELRKSIGENGRKKVLEKFCYNTFIEESERYYLDLVPIKTR